MSRAVPYLGTKLGSVERFFAGLAAVGAHPVPVTRPDHATEFQDMIRRATQEAGNGLAVR